MKLKLNGEDTEVKSFTVDALLSELNLADRKVAVELNKEIVSKSSYSLTALNMGDRVEIITFVGGG